jgi:hypothetical protein
VAFAQIMRKPWSVDEVRQLRKLVRQNTPALIIAKKLGRSKNAVYLKASRDFSEAHAEFPIKTERGEPSILLSIHFRRPTLL